MMGNQLKHWCAKICVAGSLSVAVVACSSGEGQVGDEEGSVATGVGAQPEQPQHAEPGELLARVDLTKTHYVEFRGVAGGKEGLGIIEFGQQGEAQLDRSDWEALGAEGVYARLAKQPAPPALVRAAELHRQKQLEPAKVGTTKVDLPAPANMTPVSEEARKNADPRVESIIHRFAEDPNTGIVERPESVGALRRATRTDIGGGLGKVSQAVYGDNAWFTQNLCNPTGAESSTIWCMPGYAWVQGGTRYTMYYYAAGMSHPTGQGANFYIESYNWNTSTWGTHYSTYLAPGQWVSYQWNGEVAFRSSIYGVNNSTVHMVDAQRRQITHVNYYTDLPSDHEWDDFEDYQGLTHDDNNWFVTRTQYSTFGSPQYGELTKIARSTSLNNQPNTIVAQPSTWTNFPHYGDLARRDNHLYVAMEGAGGCAVGVYTTNLVAVGHKLLAAPSGGNNHKCGWIAYNKVDQLFYAPREGEPNTKVFKYEITVSGSTITVIDRGQLTLSADISHISGADFSERGTLWLFAGYKTQPLNFYAVDTRNGFVYWRGSISHWGGSASDFEAEGLSLWDLTGGQAPGVSGHLHLQTLRNDVFSDDQIWISHWVASSPSTL